VSSTPGARGPCSPAGRVWRGFLLYAIDHKAQAFMLSSREIRPHAANYKDLDPKCLCHLLTRIVQYFTGNLRPKWMQAFSGNNHFPSHLKKYCCGSTGRIFEHTQHYLGDTMDAQKYFCGYSTHTCTHRLACMYSQVHAIAHVHPMHTLTKCIYINMHIHSHAFKRTRKHRLPSAKVHKHTHTQAHTHTFCLESDETREGKFCEMSASRRSGSDAWVIRCVARRPMSFSSHTCTRAARITFSSSRLLQGPSAPTFART